MYDRPIDILCRGMLEYKTMVHPPPLRTFPLTLIRLHLQLTTMPNPTPQPSPVLRPVDITINVESRSGTVTASDDDATATVKSSVTSPWPTILDLKRGGAQTSFTDKQWNNLRDMAIADGSETLDAQLIKIAGADGASIDWSSNAHVNGTDEDLSVNFRVQRGDLSIVDGSRPIQFSEAGPP